MQNKIKFTVIIPTRERADTLFYALNTVVAQDYDNLEILISDNSSQDNTKEVVDSFKDPRIRYINTGRRLSMSHNWEFALNHVTEGWVTIIGDDDGLLPGAISKVAEVVQATKCKAVSSKRCSYSWPGYPLYADQLHVPLTRGYEVRKMEEWFLKLLRGEIDNWESPWLYTGGFVEISAINAVRKDGVFFLSQIPDVYSSVALSATLSDYVMLNEPVSIMGSSLHSNGGSHYAATDGGAASKQFLSEERIPLHSTLEDLLSVRAQSLIVFESYLQSIHLHNDRLGIQIADQICIALAQVEDQHRDDLEKYCDRLASNHQIRFQSLSQRIRFQKFKYLVKKATIYLARFLNVAVLFPSQFGIRNVHEAAIAAKAVYLLESGSIRWRKDKILKLPLNVSGFLGRFLRITPKNS